jgi:DNA-binding transcriptional regulator YhcF (GntR family)
VSGYRELLPPDPGRPDAQPKYLKVADYVRDQVSAGTLTPGEPAPSGAQLARLTGYSTLTCRKGLQSLIREGVLVPGPSRGARPCVNPGDLPPDDADLRTAARALSHTLADRRRGASLTQPQLAQIIGTSVTTVGHAETGRAWQARRFWERADMALSADGKLLTLHDTYRAAAAARGAGRSLPPAAPDAAPPSRPPAVSPAQALAVTIPASVTLLNITWANNTVTTVYPPPADEAEDGPPD